MLLDCRMVKGGLFGWFQGSAGGTPDVRIPGSRTLKVDVHCVKAPKFVVLVSASGVDRHPLHLHMPARSLSLSLSLSFSSVMDSYS